jgi:hypothetical protein
LKALKYAFAVAVELHSLVKILKALEMFYSQPSGPPRPML